MNNEAMAVYSTANLAEGIEKILITGDLKPLSPEARVQYYNAVCTSLGINPVTRPFDYIVLNGKLTLYANKTCAEQLRRLYGVSVVSLTSRNIEGVWLVEAKVQDATGRTDVSTGAVSIGNAKGENLANALMKAETKAKRRATLSLIGLGMLDETEIETIRDARRVRVDDSGEIVATNGTERDYTGADVPADRPSPDFRQSIIDDPLGVGEPVAVSKVINSAQLKRLFTIATNNDWHKEEVRYMIALGEYGGYTSTKDVTTDHYDKIIAALESYDEHAKVHDAMGEVAETAGEVTS